MSKLDWSRASERSFDPARYQRHDDFVTPDQTTKPKRKKKRKLATQKKAAQSGVDRTRTAERALELEQKKKKAAAKAKRRAQAQQQYAAAAAEKRRLKDVERKAKAEARQAAFAEYIKSPQYAAKVAREEEKMAAKKKSHLQVWIEQETGLNVDRKSLREQWRERLLNRLTAQE